jgi:hypothetical protein
MSSFRFAGLLAAGCLALSTGALQAAPVTYQAGDAGVSLGGATPNSDAEAANFDSAAGALGTVNLIDLESAPLGAFSSLTIAPGVTVSGVGYTGSATHSIIAGDRCGSVCGFNTTAGGRKYIDVDANLITLSFASPIQAFGAYVTGLQLAAETVQFDDGTVQTFQLTNLGSGAQFFGFTDPGKLITSVIVDTRNPSNALGDFIGLDDIRYVAAASDPIPEPATLALVGLALAGVAASGRRRL